MKNLERKTRELASTYLATLEQPESFAGVRLRDLHVLDSLFGMHTLVYALGEDRNVELVHRPTDILSKRESQAAFRLNLYGAHFSYVKHLNKYSRCFTCQRCDGSFPKAYRLQRHERSCEAKVKRVYPGGVYHPSQTIWEKIEEEGIAVPPELKYSRYRATFDIEVYYPRDGTNLPEKRDKLEYTAEHQLLSISVASNVLGYEQPQCFVVEEEGREPALQTVTTFVGHLERIAKQAGELERQRFAPLLKRIEETWGVSYQPPSSPVSEQEEEEIMGEESTGFDQDSDDESEEDEDEETEEDRAFIDDDDDLEEKEDDLSFYRRVDLQWPERVRPLASPATSVQPTNRLLKKRERLLSDLRHHLAEMVVVGFNSGKYDLNVLKDILIPHLVHRSGIEKEEFAAVWHQWFPRHDTPEHAAFDKCKPGLFKVEWKGQSH